MAKTLISASNFTSLKGIPSDELEFSEDIQLGVDCYSELIGKKISPKDFIAELERSSFYPPQILVKQTGFSLVFQGTEYPLKTPLDFNEIKAEKEKSHIHLTTGTKKIALAFRFELLDSFDFEPRELFTLVNPDTPVETAQFLLSIIIPPPQSFLPEGLYKIKKIEIKEKSAKIYTECGSIVMVNTGISDKLTHIKAYNGFIYTSNEEGRCFQGISWMMNSIPLPDAEKTKALGVPECKVGSVYEIIGVSEKKFEGNPMYSATVKCLDSNVTFAIRSDKNTNNAFVISASLGRQRFATVNQIISPTGNMKYPRPVFEFSTPKEETEVKTAEVVEIETKSKKSKTVVA